MAADEAPQVPRRRGRPPGSGKAATGRSRRKRAEGGELVTQLNEMIAELIKENRRLRRQVVSLTERASAATSNTVEKGLRTIARRVRRALAGNPKRSGRKTGSAAAAKRKAAPRKRKTS